MPKTTLNWNAPTSRPRHLAGASSAMYTGPSTDDAPIPSPPTKRKTINAGQFQASPQPKAETT
jgi:hypothetical protein